VNSKQLTRTESCQEPAGWRRDTAVVLSLLLAGFSVAGCMLAWLLGFNDPPGVEVTGYKTYFQKPNWYGYPVFFVLLALPLWLSWTPFIDAWRRLGHTGVLRSRGANADDQALLSLVSFLQSQRLRALYLALAVSTAINVIDVWPVYRAYSADTYGQQLEYACRNVSFFSKWLFEAWPPESIPSNPCEEVSQDAAPPQSLGERLAPPAAQLAVVFVSYLQQFVLVTLAALVICQVLLHAWWFARLEGSTLAQHLSLTIELDPASPMHEFGLEHWNHALNNLYWAISPALIAPFISRAQVVDLAHMNPGQKMFNIFIPLAVLAPMVATIITRQVRLPAVWETLQPHGACDPALYLEQRLWPLDRNWSSKLGIIIALAGAGLVLGIEIGDLVSL